MGQASDQDQDQDQNQDQDQDQDQDQESAQSLPQHKSLQLCLIQQVDHQVGLGKRHSPHWGQWGQLDTLLEVQP